MKKINFIFILLILSACTPQVTITSEIVTSTSFPTETPIPTPTLHPEFIVWQEIISAAGGRYTLTPDGSIQENGVAINDLQVDANGIMTLTVNEDKIILSPGEVTFGKDSIKIKDYELDDNGKWVPAVSEAMQGMKDSFAKYNILSWDGYTVVEQGDNLEITDPETGKVVYKNGSFEPLFLGQLIVEKGMCRKTEWTANKIGIAAANNGSEFLKQYVQPLADAKKVFLDSGLISNPGQRGTIYHFGDNCWGVAFYHSDDQQDALMFWKDESGKVLFEQVFLTVQQ